MYELQGPEGEAVILVVRTIALIAAIVDFLGLSLAGGSSFILRLPALSLILLAVLPVVPSRPELRWIAIIAAVAMLTSTLRVLYYAWETPGWIVAAVGMVSAIVLAANHFRRRTSTDPAWK